MYRDFLDKDIWVIGCGNPLLGDDGFGPAVISSFEKKSSDSERVMMLDVGTSIRDLLFDLLLSKRRPSKIIIIDAVSQPGADAGNILTLNAETIPANKVADYSLHQFPTLNMLKELKESTTIDIRIYAVQVDLIPERVKPGLSPAITAAIPKMCDLLTLEIGDQSIVKSPKGVHHADV